MTEPQMKVAAKRVRRRRRPSLTSGKLDPRHCGVALHAMVLDRNGTSRDDLVQRLEDLLAAPDHLGPATPRRLSTDAAPAHTCDRAGSDAASALHRGSSRQGGIVFASENMTLLRPDVRQFRPVLQRAGNPSG